MKNIVVLFLLLLSMLCLLGCGQKAEVHGCVKCGKTPVSSYSGPASAMEAKGIPLGKCTNITGSIYTTYLCDECMGPVATDF